MPSFASLSMLKCNFKKSRIQNARLILFIRKNTYTHSFFSIACVSSYFYPDNMNARGPHKLFGSHEQWIPCTCVNPKSSLKLNWNWTKKCATMYAINERNWLMHFLWFGIHWCDREGKQIGKGKKSHAQWKTMQSSGWDECGRCDLSEFFQMDLFIVCVRMPTFSL